MPRSPFAWRLADSLSPAPDLSKSFTQPLDTIHEQAAFSLKQGDREKGSAGCMAADVLRHRDSLPQARGRRITLR
jgi:hypothetical protein